MQRASEGCACVGALSFYGTLSRVAGICGGVTAEVLLAGVALDANLCEGLHGRLSVRAPERRAGTAPWAGWRRQDEYPCHS